MVSLAPSTLPEDLVPAMVTVAAAARLLCRKRRRVRRGMGGLLSDGRRWCGPGRQVQLLIAGPRRRFNRPGDRTFPPARVSLLRAVTACGMLAEALPPARRP